MPRIADVAFDEPYFVGASLEKHLSPKINMLLKLPAEITLGILSNLTLPSLSSLRVVSREWNAFFVLNETTIFRNAAVLHHFIGESDTSVTDFQSVYAKTILKDVKDWKTLCRKQVQIERGWLGRGTPKVRHYPAAGQQVHRIKVDEEAGYILTTSRDGGLTVTDLHTHELLWSLSKDHILPYAHCEYDQGFIVLSQDFGSYEVWRRGSDFQPEEVPSTFPPSPMQAQACAEADEMHQASSGRGHFKPWALIWTPTMPPTSASRFIFPTLLASSMFEVHLWDLKTGTLSQTISNIQARIDGHVLGKIRYVDFNDHFTFVCGTIEVRIFSREDGALALRIQPSLSFPRWRLELNPTEPPSLSSVLTRCDVQALPPDPANANLYDGFLAVHVSPCGQDLVILRRYQGILIIKNFEQVAKGKLALTDTNLEINIPSEAKYLALASGRVAVAMAGGILVLNLHPEGHGIDMPKALRDPVYPYLSICRSHRFYDREAASVLSCLQITETSVYFTWDSNSFEREQLFLLSKDESSALHESGATSEYGKDIQLVVEGASDAGDPTEDSEVVDSDSDSTELLEDDDEWPGEANSSVFRIDMSPDGW